MKIKNHLNNEKISLKQKAQNILKSMEHYDVLFDKNLLCQIEEEILNKANQGKTELTIFLRKFVDSEHYEFCHGFAQKSVVIDLDDYPTTSMESVYEDLVTWFVSKGFNKEDVYYKPPVYSNFSNPLIASVTVKW